jgi:hypothetical protein
VVSFVLALILVSHGRAANETEPSHNIEPGDVVSDDWADADQSAICCQSDSPHLSDEWRHFLFGSACASHIYVGTEFTALNIDSQTGGRTTLSFSDTTAPGVSTVSFNDPGGVEDWGYAPRVWLGAQITDKWGVRGRYWRLSDSDTHLPERAPGTTPIGTNFATIFTTDHVEAWTSDFEVVRSDEWWGWKADGFVGGRHASYSADSDLLAFGVFTSGNFVNMTLQNACGFDGDGVTYGGSLRRRIGCSHLYAFGSVRGSQLVGYSNSLGRADGTVASSPSAPLVGAATVTRNHADAELSIFELQAGFEFEWALRNIPANFFFRTAYEVQEWDIDGLPTGGAGFGGTIGELTTNSFARAGLGGMTLHGISIGTGLTW